VRKQAVDLEFARDARRRIRASGIVPARAHIDATVRHGRHGELHSVPSFVAVPRGLRTVPQLRRQIRGG